MTEMVVLHLGVDKRGISVDLITTEHGSFGIKHGTSITVTDCNTAIRYGAYLLDPEHNPYPWGKGD